MRYRTLPDPHFRFFEWRVYNGCRQFRESALELHEWPGFPGAWKFSPDHYLAKHTPERIAVWAELALNPTL